MSNALDIQGRRFGKLTAVEELPRQNRLRMWRLLCDCGGERVLQQKAFASGGKARSCGCDTRREIKHGLSTTPEYRHWVNMITRCEDPNATGFENYGGRGIKVCERWRSDVRTFYADMGPRPSPRHSVDRIDVNGHYEPGNCRWATPTEQSRNTRTNRLVVVNGVPVTLAEAVGKAPVPYNTVLYRLKRGWKLDDALSRVAKKGFRP